jgi:hypothetical protein
MSETIVGVRIPDNRIAREAAELIRDTTTPLIYHRPRRVFVFGSLQSRVPGIESSPNCFRSQPFSTTPDRYYRMGVSLVCQPESECSDTSRFAARQEGYAPVGPRWRRGHSSPGVGREPLKSHMMDQASSS